MPLPDTISNLTSLTELDCSSNQLTALPEGIGKLRNLTHLNLEHNRFSKVPDALLGLPNTTEVLLLNNPLPDQEILHVRNLLAQRRQQGLPTPMLLLPPLQNEMLNQEDALRRAAEGGMNVHVPELTATVGKRINELAAQFPEHLRGDPNTQKQEMLTIQERLGQALEQYGAQRLDDEGNANLPKALVSMKRMFAVGLGKARAYVNDFDYTPGHVLSYVMLAMERQWEQTPPDSVEEAKHNGIEQLIKRLVEAKGNCDTRLIEEVFQLADMALSKYAEQHPEIIGAKPVSLSSEQVRDITFPVAKRVLNELLQGPSPVNRTEAQIQTAFRQALTAQMRRDHPAIQTQPLADYIDRQIMIARESFVDLARESSV